MFNGIIQEIGKVVNILKKGGVEFTVSTSNSFLSEMKIGDSVAINGACQTIISLTENKFSFYTSSETLSITNLKFLTNGTEVNLEKPISLSTLIHGHIVMGHVDDVAIIKNIENLNNSYHITLKIPAELVKYTIKKGSISVNGISLTIYDKILPDKVVVIIIPHTYNFTNLKRLTIDDKVNIEVDLMAKYMENMLRTVPINHYNNKNSAYLDLLKNEGFI